MALTPAQLDTARAVAARYGVTLDPWGAVVHPDCLCCRRTRAQARDTHERLLIESLGFCQTCSTAKCYNNLAEARRRSHLFLPLLPE